MSVEGTWNVKLQTPMGERPATLKLSDSGGTLSGTVSSEQGDAELSGTLVDDAVQLKAKLTGPMGEIELDFSGTLKGDEISGSVKLGQFGEGSWTATRA